MASDKELDIGFKIGTSAFMPIAAEVSFNFQKRWAGRAKEVAENLAAAVGDIEKLGERAAASEEIDMLINKALSVGANSDLKRKRRLLAQVAAAAVLDDAKIDESILLINILAEIDAVHVRSLESIRRAELEALETGERGPIPRGAEKRISPEVQKAAQDLPHLVLRKLLSLNLIDGAITWDGVAVITGLTNVGEGLLEDLATTLPE